MRFVLDLAAEVTNDALVYMFCGDLRMQVPSFEEFSVSVDPACFLRSRALFRMVLLLSGFTVHLLAHRLALTLQYLNSLE